MTEAIAKRKGRPPKSDLGPATVSLAMRIRPELYEEIRRDAEASGRSISAQAERRLVHPEPDASDVGRIVGLTVEAIEQRAGKRWSKDASVKRKCRAAADFALNVLLGSPVDVKALRSAIDFKIDALEAFVSGKPGLLTKALGAPDPKELKRMIATLQDWSDGQGEADSLLETILEGKS